jgi:catechol 2,3-dioxygenase-like lactoylglutathione lyase family enzyme
MSTPIRRLDHVAVLVRSTKAALEYFSGELGLEVAHQDQLASPPVRLTYLDCGNAWIQLVEPLDPAHPLAQQLEAEGEGLHHLGFGVVDPMAAARELAGPGAPEPIQGSGRGRVSVFVPTLPRYGVRVECTEFRPEDVGALESS